MPVIEAIAPDYIDEVDFIAVAWKGSFEDTAEEAARLIPSGNVRWGLDESEEIFAAFGINYQPASVFVTHDGIFAAGWAGARGEEETRAALDQLVAAGK